MSTKTKVIFLTILFLAAALRIWKAGVVPPSPDWDEASLGYNAYSILSTGRDEYGSFLPVILRSFDDYKPALYAYLDIPFVAVFGLTVVAVRLPSIIFGVLTVAATFFLVRQLVGTAVKIFHKEYTRDVFALTASLLLAISPWHIQFSRIAFESNVGLALNIFAFLFFLKSFKKPLFLTLASFCASLSFHVYQSEKVFIPLLFTALLFIFRKEFLKTPKKWIIAAFLVAFVVLLPMFTTLVMNKDSFLRAKGVSVFSNITELLKRNTQKLQEDAHSGDVIGMVLDNRRIVYAKTIISGYISHFDLNWLFITGDLSRHHAPFMGLLYLVELPFLLLGIYIFMFGNISSKSKNALLAYFLFAPIPASVTSGVPHAVRTLNFLPIFQIFTALGLLGGYTYIQRFNRSIQYALISLTLTLFMFNFLYYINQYFTQLNYFTSRDWQYGYKETVDYITPLMNKYDRVLVSNAPPLDQSYMFFLFYTRYNPKQYQEQGGTVSGGFKEDHKGFFKFRFQPINWENRVKNGKILYVGRPEDFPGSAHTLKTVYYLDGSPAIKIVDE